VREIVRVATAETEEAWLEKARTLSCHDLEREVRQREGLGAGSGERATLTISLPIELLRTCNECYELAERLSAANLEKFQVLEPMMAEFLSACLPAEDEDGPSPHATAEETSVSLEVRRAVFERDGYQCTMPGCTMRKMLDPHHIVFRSHGGGDEPSNLTTLCRVHHGLVHRGICRIRRSESGELVFERPPLFSERPAVAAPAPESESESEHPPEDVADDSEDWRERTVADIFDDAPPPAPSRPTVDYGDFLLAWMRAKTRAKQEDARNDRAHCRRRNLERRLSANGRIGGRSRKPP
jgi:HNH endonuclease